MKQTARFHPAVEQWFAKHFAAPTAPQARAWPLIQAGRNVLIAAPTGSGKTLAAFLAAIDDLVRQGVDAPLPDETLVVYVSPLKALSNDIQRNLAAPLAGIRRELAELGLPDVEIRTLVRTGDTPQTERASMRKRPPHIVVTTPESLYVLLGLRVGTHDARDDAHGDRRRDPRARRQQARQPSRAVARAARRADARSRRCASGCPRRRSRSRRSRASWSGARHGRAGRRGAPCEIVDVGPCAAARSRARSAVVAARSGDVARGLGAGLRAARRARGAAPHHARVRQHAAHGRARGAPPVRAARRRARDVASRQHGEGAAAQGRAAAEERRAEGAGRHRVARARHRHRRRRARLPARLAALDRDLPAARGTREPSGRRRAQGAALSAVARRAGRVRGAARCGAARRARSRVDSATSRSTCSRSRSSPRSPRANGRKRRSSTLFRRAYPVSRSDARRVPRRRAHAGGRLHHAPRPSRRRTCIAMR